MPSATSSALSGVRQRHVVSGQLGLAEDLAERSLTHEDAVEVAAGSKGDDADHLDGTGLARVGVSDDDRRRVVGTVSRRDAVERELGGAEPAFDSEARR